MALHRVLGKTELANGKAKMVVVNGQPIAVFNVNNEFYAIGDRCTHRGAPLHQGYLDGTTVTCPLHNAQFDIKTGQNLSPPAPAKVASYKIHVQGNDVMIEL